jgi:hypothetical protein
VIQAIQKNVTWRAIPIAGFVAGAVFLLVNLVLTPLYLDVDASVIINYIASLALGKDMLTDDTSPVIIAVALIVHGILSLAFTLVIAIVVHRWGLTVGVIGSAILWRVYAINLYTLTLLFEWFFAINSWVLAVSHVAFGVLAGGIYELLDRYDRPFKLIPPPAHAEMNRE